MRLFSCVLELPDEAVPGGADLEQIKEVLAKEVVRRVEDALRSGKRVRDDDDELVVPQKCAKLCADSPPPSRSGSPTGSPSLSPSVRASARLPPLEPLPLPATSPPRRSIGGACLDQLAFNKRRDTFLAQQRAQETAARLARFDAAHRAAQARAAATR